VRSHWLASSITTTSKRPSRGSKLSTTRDSGMIQTGTADRARESSSRAFTCSSGARAPVPRPIWRWVSAQPIRA
jgi:hypothetical protein